MSIKSRLLVILSLILVATFLVTSLINYAVTRSAVREELINSSLPLTGKNIYSEIHAALMRPILVSSSMASDSFLKNWVIDGETTPEKIKQYLQGLKDAYGFTTAFFVSAKTDNYYYCDGILKKINPRDPHDIWYYAFVRSGKKYHLDVDTNQAEHDTLSIFINFRVEDAQGKLLGVTGVGVNMDKATALLAEAQKEFKRNVYLVDQDGLIQVHSDIHRIQRFYITKGGGIRDVADAILVPSEKAANHEYDWEGNHMLLSTRYIPEFEWFLIVEQDEGRALIPARKNLLRTLAIGGIASILIIIVCVFTVNLYQDRLEHLAKTDPLTGAANRRALDEYFALSSYKCTRYGIPLSIIIIDLDNFKSINDEHGHLTGDGILKTVAETITATIRPGDLLARWGGDEFIVLMDGTPDDAKNVIGRIRAAVCTSSTIPIYFSSGIAQFSNGDDLNTLSHRADTAMYEAKSRGGDQSVAV